MRLAWAIVSMGACAATLLTCLAAGADTNATLRIVVSGHAAPTAHVLVAVFNSAKAFPYGSPVAQMAIPLAGVDSNGAVSCAFTLGTGDYAVAVFHDMNGNGKLDTTPLGIPVEKCGFSRNPGFRLGPPRFNDAAIDLSPAGTQAAIRLK